MGRALGANAKLAFGFESTEGTPPGSGFFQVPFVSSGIGDEQPLIASDLLGAGRDPLPPSLDVITNNGDIVVPLDLRYFGLWLKLLYGAPTTTQGTAAIGSFTFADIPEDGSAITVGGADWTFKASGPTGDQSLIAATLEDTLANAVLGLNASATAALAACTYSLNIDGKTIDLTYDSIGTGGNSVTLAATDSGDSADSHATPSGATMSGGATSGPYNHVFTSGATELLSAAIEVGNPDVPSYSMNYGVKADKLAITLARSGNLNATISLIAIGEQDPTNATQAGTPSELTLERFANFSASVRRDGVPIGNLTSGTYNYANGLSPVEDINEDGRISGVDPGQIAVNGQNVFRFKNETFRNLARNNTPVEFAHQWKISDTKKLRIVTHYVILPRGKRPISGPGGIQESSDWQAAKHPVIGRSTTVTLINDKSSY